MQLHVISERIGEAAVRGDHSPEMSVSGFGWNNAAAEESFSTPASTSSEQKRLPILGFLSDAARLSATWLSSPKVLALTVVGCLGTYFLGLMVSIAISRASFADRQAQERAESPATASVRIIADAGCRWQGLRAQSRSRGSAAGRFFAPGRRNSRAGIRRRCARAHRRSG